MPKKIVKQGSRAMTLYEQQLHRRVNAVNQKLDDATNELLHECHAYIPDRERVTLILMRIAAIALNEAQDLATSP